MRQTRRKDWNFGKKYCAAPHTPPQRRSPNLAIPSQGARAEPACGRLGYGRLRRPRAFRHSRNARRAPQNARRFIHVPPLDRLGLFQCRCDGGGVVVVPNCFVFIWRFTRIPPLNSLGLFCDRRGGRTGTLAKNTVQRRIPLAPRLSICSFPLNVCATP